MRKAGSDGYKYITVEEELAANVIFANKLMIHLTSKQIPKSIGVSLSDLPLSSIIIKVQNEVI